MLARLFACQHETATTADRLALALADLQAANSALARVKTSLDHYIGQTIRARAERDRAEQEREQARACLVQAMAEQGDAISRALALEDEVRDLTGHLEGLIGIADGLRDELRELRAAVTIGAAQKRGKR